MMDHGERTQQMQMRRRSMSMLAWGVAVTVTAGGGLPLHASDEATSAEAEQVYQRKWTEAELREVREASQEWFGQPVVRMDYAPPPWTPMVVDGQAIESWGKVYRYSDSVLPVQMTSQALELLAGEPRFVLRSDGQEHEFREAEVTIEKVHEGLVQATAVSQSGPFTLEVKVGYEFDGMGKVEVALSADGSPTVESLHLELPISAERAQLFHMTGSRHVLPIPEEQRRGAAAPPISDSGWVPEETWQLDAFREILWFGDQTAGLSWFADGMHGWPISGEDEIQVLEPERDGARLLRVKFADRSFTLDEPLELVFGLQATPMRPRRDDFRSRVGWMLPDFDGPVEMRWRWGDGYYYPFHETYPEKAREDVEAVRAQGRELLTTSSLEYFGPHRFYKTPYGVVDHPGMIHREVLFWKDQWNQVRTFEGSVSDAQQRHEEALRRHEAGDPGGRSVEEVLALDRHTAEGEWYGQEWRPSTYPERFCYNETSSFADYYTWKLKELVEQTGKAAIYLDQQLYYCANPDHGCGYVNYDGEWMGQGNVFGMRDAAKRLYFAFVEGNGTAPLVMWHSSHQLIIPAISFAEIFWEGEKYTIPDHERSILGREFYSEFLDEAVMQVQHMGKPFGFTGDFLPQLTRAQLRSMPITSPAVASARDMVGLMLIHDSHLDAYRPLTYHGDLISHILTKRATYPLDEMQVSYYWEDDALVHVEQSDVRFIMHYDDEHALLILFNWSGEMQRAQVSIDPPTQSTGEPTVHDVFSKEQFGQDLQNFEIDLLPRDFRMLEVRW
ncbi:glycoside hydrolase domain-containing protein [Phycisphaerales bacterium AB-hyl4]|uniref:Glycoside hydrolase domain-containing protein n=1 Tax=Natronomicrosphaera hydrolytica TaxID=3242702 RepID=A0ABV4U2L9_9BACT